MPDHYLALCAIVRDEGPYLAEWIAFHRLVGVERFHLYDNGSTDETMAVLAPLIADGVVTVRPWSVPFHLHASREAYSDCLERVRGHGVQDRGHRRDHVVPPGTGSNHLGPELGAQVVRRWRLPARLPRWTCRKRRERRRWWARAPVPRPARTPPRGAPAGTS